MTLAERQVLKLGLEDDARMEEGILNDGVASRLLFFGEGDLCEIIRSLVGIVGQRVGSCGSFSQRVAGQRVSR